MEQEQEQDVEQEQDEVQEQQFVGGGPTAGELMSPNPSLLLALRVTLSPAFHSLHPHYVFTQGRSDKNSFGVP